MSLQNLILFCSTTSQACGPCLNFVYQHRLPIQVVRLDTPEARDRATRGKYFQIRAVPTLVVIRKGGDVQLFSGQQKVGGWLQNLVSRKAPRQPEPETHLEAPPQPMPQPRSQPRSRRKTPVVYSSGSDLEEEFPTHQGLYDKPSKPRRRSSRRRSKSRHKSRRKKPEPVIEEYDSEEDEVEIEFVNSPDPEPSGRPHGPSTSGLMVGPQAQSQKKSNTVSVFDIAKKMEKERTSSLGYNEKDLPTPSY